MKQLRSAGFTLIELLTVVTITAIISVVAVAILVNLQLRGTKATTISKVRQTGAFLLDQMTFILRNGRYLLPNQNDETCSPVMTAIRVRTLDGNSIELYRTEDFRIASESAQVISDPPSAYLSGDDIRIDDLTFTCSQGSGEGGARVQINLTVSTGSQQTLSPESYYSQTFTTQVYVRASR